MFPCNEAKAALLAYVAFYDQSVWGIETSLKGNKQGLGLTKHNKKRFAAKPYGHALGQLGRSDAPLVRAAFSLLNLFDQHPLQKAFV